MTGGWRFGLLLAVGAPLTWLCRSALLLTADTVARTRLAADATLTLVAPAVLAAVIGPALLPAGRSWPAVLPGLTAALVTVAVAWWRRSTWLAVAAGLAVFVLAKG